MMQTNKFQILVDLLKKTDYNAKISETEGKVSSITGLDTTAALTTVENKIPNISNLVKKRLRRTDMVLDLIEMELFK